MASFRPLHDRVLVRRVSSEERTHSGLILPETAKEKPQQAEVVAVGTGSRNKNDELVPLSVKKGDIVLFGKYSGNEIKVDGEEMLILQETDILAILDN